MDQVGGATESCAPVNSSGRIRMWPRAMGGTGRAMSVRSGGAAAPPSAVAHAVAPLGMGEDSLTHPPTIHRGSREGYGPRVRLTF